MSVNPDTSAWWNVAFALTTLVGAGALHFAGVPDAIRQIIQSWAVDIAAVISCANVVLHLYSSDTKGYMVR